MSQRQKKLPTTKNKTYFKSNLDDIIKKYNDETDPVKKQLIFTTEIYDTFKILSDKLVQYFGSGLEDKQIAKADLLTYLYEQLHHYDSNKSKSFSYFSVVGRNHVFGLNKQQKERKQSFVQDFDLAINGFLSDEDDISYSEEFFYKYIVFLDNTLEYVLKTKKELQIGYALLEIMLRVKYLNNFNKKALVVMIQDMTNADEKTIAKVFNKLKHQYFKRLTNYINKEEEAHTTEDDKWTNLITAM
ncbi:MAG: hypothetical protein M0R17_13420 [Candidatus Omnitrophica bacterium]|jgi:hypothetical protein|nr:hypothetical protein [Candidatus Omnitrophota bacterium]